MEDTEGFVDRRSVNRVVIDSVENGAGRQIRWFVRGVWTLAAIVATSAFYVGNTMKSIENNAQDISELMDRSERSAMQHEGIIEALGAITAIQQTMDRDVERLKDANQN